MYEQKKGGEKKEKHSILTAKKKNCMSLVPIPSDETT